MPFQLQDATEVGAGRRPSPMVGDIGASVGAGLRLDLGAQSHPTPQDLAEEIKIVYKFDISLGEGDTSQERGREIEKKIHHIC